MHGFDPSEAFTSLGLILQVFLLAGDPKSNPTTELSRKPRLLSRQQDALTQFKDRVVKNIPQAYSYLKTDFYLTKWLRGTNYNVDEATRNFLEELRWRDENKLDQILSEDMTDLDFVYSLNQTDSEGHPILLVPLEQWDPRKTVFSGQGKRLERFVFRMFVDADAKLRQLQAEGKNVTKITAVVNMQGFNIFQHACLPCVPYYSTLLMDFEKHFPESLHRAVFVNTPAVFEFILTAMRSVMSQSLKDMFEVYGSNRRTWDPAIAQIIQAGDNEDSYEDY